MAQVVSETNVALTGVVPQYLPNTTGVNMPNNVSTWKLTFDTGGTIPAGLIITITVEYQRNAWTDASGTQHPAGEWLPDCGGTFVTGSILARDGTSSTTRSINSTIGAVTQNGVMVEPAPTHARVRVDQAPAVTLPSITLVAN